MKEPRARFDDAPYLHTALELRAVLLAVLCKPDPANMRVVLWDWHCMLVLHINRRALGETAFEIRRAIRLAHTTHILGELMRYEPSNRASRIL